MQGAYGFALKLDYMFSIGIETLGTMVVLNGDFDLELSMVAYLKNVNDRLAGMDTNIGVMDLSRAMASSGFGNIDEDLRLFDMSTPGCFPNLFDLTNRTQDPCKLDEYKDTCCCDHRACNYGTFQSILTVMKESLGQQHVLDQSKTFDIVKDDLKLINVTPSYANEEFVGFPLFIKKSHNAPESLRFLNSQPLVPFCNFNGHWGTKADHDSFYDMEFCDLFKPTLSDNGICYSFNADDSLKAFADNPYLEAFKQVQIYLATTALL